jgi:hypothetical protein
MACAFFSITGISTATVASWNGDALTTSATPPGVELLLVEEVGETAGDRLPLMKSIEDEERLERILSWLDNEAAAFAMRLYAEAWRLSAADADKPAPFAIAIAVGGNNARQGFLLAGAPEEHRFEKLPYIVLEERSHEFAATLLHETGHSILKLLGPTGAYEAPIGYVQHTTPVVTDRWTAFNEGFAIHLETVYAERVSDPDWRRHFDNRSRTFGERGLHRTAPVSDLRTLAQTRQRFNAVRDNRFAHPTAYRGSDLLRAAIDPERDLARLRNASQLLACEGFVATVFYRLVTTSSTGDSLSDLDYSKLFQALKTALSRNTPKGRHCWLTDTISALSSLDPKARDVFLDLSRGATVSNEVVAIWWELYQAALQVDLAGYRKLEQTIHEQFRSWISSIDSGKLDLNSAVGPEVPVCVVGVSVSPQYYDGEVPVCFDLNAADLAELLAIQGADSNWVDSVVVERIKRPFSNLDDLWERVGGNKAVRANLVPPS